LNAGTKTITKWNYASEKAYIRNRQKHVEYFTNMLNYRPGEVLLICEESLAGSWSEIDRWINPAATPDEKKKIKARIRKENLEDI